MIIAALVAYLVMSVLMMFPTYSMFTRYTQVTLASPLLTAAFSGHLFLAVLSFRVAVWLIAVVSEKRLHG